MSLAVSSGSSYHPHAGCRHSTRDFQHSTGPRPTRGISAILTPPDTFRQFIRKARLEKGLTLKAVAMAIGANEMMIVNVERYLQRSFKLHGDIQQEAECLIDDKQLLSIVS